jgi:selenocysteine-specific elongation factor
VSSATGAGVEELRAAIAAAAAEASARPSGGPARLPMDRVFTMKGHGTVVTGTLASGRLRTGDQLVALPGGATGQVRGLQVHGAARSEAVAGERVALNLQGATKEALGRGEVLVRPSEIEGSAVVDVELTVLALVPRPLKARAKLLWHALTTQENAVVIPLEGAAIEPGATAMAQVHLGRKVALLPGDRFILRGFATLPGYGTTVAGGRVLRVHAPRRRRADADAAAELRAMAAAPFETRLALEVAGAGSRGIDRAGLRGRLGESAARVDEALGRLLSRGEAVTIQRDAGTVVAARVLADASQATLAALDAFHAREPLRPGAPREELRAQLHLGQPLATRVLADLAARGEVVVDGDLVRRAAFSPAAAEAGKDAAVDRVRGLYRAAGLAPPWMADVAAAAAVSAGDARAAVDILLRRGDLVRVRPDLYFDREAMDALRARLRAHLESNGQISAQEWKAMTGQTRKYAIPLGEHFDAEKLTLRVGETRKLRGR